jgi:hypothetical protein
MPVQPRLHGKQPEDRKRHHANPLVRNCHVRQQSENGERRKRDQQTIHTSLAYSARDFGGKTHAAKSWCTGKDSNLRTSLGGTDLQSVGFNHSPTCAETAQASAPIWERSVPTALYGVAQTRNGLAGCATQKIRSGAHTLAHEKSLHFGKVPKWSALRKLALLNCFRRPAG